MNEPCEKKEQIEHLSSIADAVARRREGAVVNNGRMLT
jgi:hypothetical protein